MVSWRLIIKSFKTFERGWCCARTDPLALLLRLLPEQTITIKTTQKMEAHYQLSDAEFKRQFADCELDPSIFSHEAHLRLAWIHIQQYGLEQAIENIQAQLKKFVSHVGAEDKYHETLTVAAVQAVSHFMEQSQSENFKDFIGEFPQLKHSFKELIGSHYSFDVFSSDKARTVFLEPDLLPFG